MASRADRSASPASLPRSPGAVDYWAASGVVRQDDRNVHARQRKFAELFTGCSDVVDLGCGQGGFLGLLRDYGVRAFGVDASATACAACADAGLHVVQADVVEYLLEDGEPFGGVFSAGLLEHLERGAVETIVARAAERLSPGGLFVTVLPNPASILAHLQMFHEDPTHVRFYPARYLATLCRASGLDVLRITEDADTLAGWGGRFTADFAQLDGLARQDASLGVLVRIVADLADHFNAVIDQFVRPLEFCVVARKPASAV
jgi:O-antigen chain-terminating methyltransferase